VTGVGEPPAEGRADGGAAIRCLIADDQAMVRESFAAILAAQPGITVAGQAGDGAQAVSQARRLRPDVVLLDVRMPVMNGLAAARELLSGGEPGPRVLMLTTFDLDEYVYEALRAGASGFLLKDATTAELVHAVRVVAAGDARIAMTSSATLRSSMPVSASAAPAGAAISAPGATPSGARTVSLRIGSSFAGGCFRRLTL
jgi:DNA-binding NarL/FixJ family response regulator